MVVTPGIFTFAASPTKLDMLTALLVRTICFLPIATLMKKVGFRTHPRPMLALAGMFSEAVSQGQHWVSASVVQASESMLFFGLVCCSKVSSIRRFAIGGQSSENLGSRWNNFVREDRSRDPAHNISFVSVRSVTKKSCGTQRKDLATKYRILQFFCCFLVPIAMVNSALSKAAHQIYSGRFWGTRFPTAKSSGGCPLIFPGFCKRSQISNLHSTMLDSPPIRGLLQQYDGVFGFFRPTIWRKGKEKRWCLWPNTGTWTTSMSFTILAIFPIFFAN